MILKMVPQFNTKQSIVIVFLCLISLMVSCGRGTNCKCGNNCKSGKIHLSRVDLMKRFGQDGTTFNDGKSCYRDCSDDKPKICYYEFMVDTYDTMSGLCRNCVHQNIDDCFNIGCIPANGVQRNIMTVNRRLPGMPINVCKGDRVIIDVMNELPGSETVIHWHGILQEETPFMDGVAMVTQCPILSGNTFRYDFNVPQPGSFWYHSHSGVQRGNGIFGSFTVRQENDPNAKYYDYDRAEHSIVLSDWNNFLSEEFIPGHKNQPLRPDSILINGCGSFNNVPFGNFTFAPMAVFYVERGKRHLFRLVNTGSHNCPMEFSIEEHRLKVTATDSYSIIPVTVDRIVSAPGERYDFVMDARSDLQTMEKLMRVRALGGCENLKLQEFARIIFVDNLDTFEHRIQDQTPLVTRPSYKSLDDPTVSYLNHPHTDCTDQNSNSYCVAALQQKQIPYPTGGNLRNKEIKKRFKLEFRNVLGTDRSMNYFTIGDFAVISAINNISMMHPPISVLTQDDSDVKYCNAKNLPANCDRQDLCNCIHLIPLKLCEVYEFFLYDSGRRGGSIHHPIHLHGYGFQVVDMGSMEQYKSGSTAFADSSKLPPVKDVISVPSGGFVRLRFRSCNAGYWLLHCHFEFHMHTGMMAIIKVGEKEDMVKPPPNFPTCGDYLPKVSFPQSCDSPCKMAKKSKHHLKKLKKSPQNVKKSRIRNRISEKIKTFIKNL
ncbi:laccase-3-like isoform X2 [Contarinia nasturtii]|uniref:laccase-3-like isoform X2 n=1 Tax=Contarinia nasturtii TaxID=265458 RepID=UPI0012D3B618|nr:laccase-3-like isoform X2 [Contarinia nasturtii]